MKKEEPASEYRAYLLRMWREEAASSWRASLQDAHTGESHGFATLERLYTFLLQQISLIETGFDADETGGTKDA